MRIVIKLGSSTLMYGSGGLNIRRTEKLCEVIADIANAGHEIVIVSSGAVAMGAGRMGFGKRPSDIKTKQACAAVGQCELMYTYDKLFSDHRRCVAQILLTKSDIENDHRRENFINTVERLLCLGVIPIINENDTVAVDEIVIGDNDTLAAGVTANIKADMLIILSDTDGLYDSDPHVNPEAKLIPVVYSVDESIESLAAGTVSSLGTGGMQTKIKAAKTVVLSGADMIIANGAEPALLYDIVDGKSVGTLFVGKRKNQGQI